ncbi:MAG: ABC transporter permease [Ornithinimicrobium sp.]
MIRLVRTEVLKYTTTRMVWGMALAMFLLGAIFAAITAAFLIYGSFEIGGQDVKATTIIEPLTLARMVYTGGIQIGYLLALVIGVLNIGGEFRHKTVSGTFLATPVRSKVIGAKVLALVVIATGNAIVHLLGCLIGGGVLLFINDFALFPEPLQLLRTFVMVALVLALWMLMGLGVGVLIPNQVAALFVAVAAAWIVEPLLGFLLTLTDWGSEVGRYFPSQATATTLGVFDNVDPGLTQALGGAVDQPAWYVAALILLAYAGVMALIGLLLTRSRDIA